MSSVVEDNDIEDIAALWVLRMDRGALSDAEQRELGIWLDADPRHRGGFVRAQAMWLDLDRVAALHAGRQPADTMQEPTRFARAASVAGAFLAVALTLAGTSLYFSGREATQLGEIRRITLDDGSALALNTSSVVQVKFEEDERRVILRIGEASFQVVRDERRPFVVEAGDVSIRAVGTAFTVRLEAQRVEVTVSEGVVEVVRATDTARAGEEKEKELVGHNLQVVAEQALPLATIALTDSEIARRRAWEDGRLVFDGERLDQAVAEVNRYAPTPVVIDAVQLREKSFVGVFRIGDARGFAHAAAAAFDVHVREENGALHLME